MSEQQNSEGGGSQDGDPKSLVIPVHCNNLITMLDKLDAVGPDQLFQDRDYTANGDWISILTSKPPDINWEMCRVIQQLKFSQDSRFAEFSGGLLVETHTRDGPELVNKGLTRNLLVSLNQGEAWCIQPLVTTKRQLKSLMDREQNETNQLNKLPLVMLQNVELEELVLVAKDNFATSFENPTYKETF